MGYYLSDLFMMNFVCILCSSTPGQIQYDGFKRALAKKSGEMIRDRVRILYLLFLWSSPIKRVNHPASGTPSSCAGE